MATRRKLKNVNFLVLQIFSRISRCSITQQAKRKHGVKPRRRYLFCFLHCKREKIARKKRNEQRRTFFSASFSCFCWCHGEMWGEATEWGRDSDWLGVGECTTFGYVAFSVCTLNVRLSTKVNIMVNEISSWWYFSLQTERMNSCRKCFKCSFSDSLWWRWSFRVWGCGNFMLKVVRRERKKGERWEGNEAEMNFFLIFLCH